MAKVFDIVICPTCNGDKEIESGQMLKDDKIYLIREQCTKCHGRGKVGKEREVSNDKG